MEAAVAGRAVCRVEEAHLSLEPEDRAVHQGLAEEMGGVVGEVAGWEVVGAVDDDVVVLEYVEGVCRVQVLANADDLDVRVHRLQPIGRRLGLGPADVFDTVQDLTLEVGGVDVVEVDDADLADPSRSQVEPGGRAQAARAQQEHARPHQLALTFAAHLGQDQMSRIAGDLIRGEAVRGSHHLLYTRGRRFEFRPSSGGTQAYGRPRGGNPRAGPACLFERGSGYP